MKFEILKIQTNGCFEDKRINRVFYVTLSLFIYTVAVSVLCVVNEEFADLYNSVVAATLRLVLSLLTCPVPFSLGEILVVLLPIVIIVGVVLLVKRIINKKIRWKILGKKLLIVFFCLFSVFMNVFGVSYFSSPLDKKLGLDRIPLTRKELYDDAEYTAELLSKAAENVVFDNSGASVNPHSHGETDKLVNKGYEVLSKSGVYKSRMVGRTKRILLSPLMTYTHISGMYMPFTGEANINTNYPDYVVAFTIAHEKAHQRGIASEDEANFMAFLACMASGDEYLEYAALMTMYDYILGASFRLDIELYNELVEITPMKAIGEMYAYFKFFEKYSDSSFSMLAESINDAYLKTMGNEDGVKSYGLVIELYHAYINKEKG